MKEIIASTTYENKNLIIYKDQNQICFGKLENNQIITSLTLEEQEVLKNVYQQITIDKQNSLDCGTFKIQGKQIKIYYCKTSNLYYFYEIINNKLQIPEQKLLTELNIYYNNEQETLYHIDDILERCNNLEKLEDTPNYAKKSFNKTIKLYMATLSVILAGNVVFQELPVLNYELYYHTTPKIKVEQEEQYSFSKIKQAIETNPNLTEEEKSYFLLLQQELKENQAYISQERICKILNDIKIKYHDKYHEINVDSGKMGVAGLYHPRLNKIDLYKLNISETPKVLFHEINHSLTDFNNQFQDDSLLSNPNYLLETTNELFTTEYFEEIAQSNPFPISDWIAYYDQMVVMYPLCEILDDKTIRNYKFNGKVNVILEELLSIDPDMSKAANLITAINSIELYQKNTIEKYNKTQEMENESTEKQDAVLQELYNAKQEQDENKQTIYNSIKNYYEKKYNRPMNEDQLMMAYFSNPDFRIPEAEDQIKSIYGENKFNSGIFIEGIKPKGYISESYKENHKNVELMYSQNGIEYILKINDKNRYSKDKITPIPMNNITEEMPNIPEETSKTR